MKIAFIGQKGFPATWGGVEVHVHNLAVELGELGHEVTVFNRTWYAPPQVEPARFRGVRLVNTPSIRSASLDAITHALSSTLVASLRAFDVIHYHCMGPSLLSWLPRALGQRVVTTIHGVDYEAVKWGFVAKHALRLGEWSALRAATRTTVVAQHLQRRYAARGYATTYLPNGVEPIQHEPLSELPGEHGLERGRYLLFLARLEENKGGHELIEAFGRCRKRGLFDGIRLVIAGGAAWQSPYAQGLRHRGAVDVCFTGQVAGKAKNALLSNAAAFVTPSWFEGLPITLLEAMSAALPCIASDIPAHRELLDDGVSGLFHPARSVEGLEQTLQRLGELGQGDLRRLGSAAQSRSRAYTWAATAREIEGLYAEVAQSSGATFSARIRARKWRSKLAKE